MPFDDYQLPPRGTCAQAGRGATHSQARRSRHHRSARFAECSARTTAAPSSPPCLKAFRGPRPVEQVRRWWRARDRSLRQSLAAAAYLIGSIPFGFLVARARGYRRSRAWVAAISAPPTVARSLGKKSGVIVLVLDALKGRRPSCRRPMARRCPAACVPVHALIIVGVARNRWPLLPRLAPVLAGGQGSCNVSGHLPRSSLRRP